MAHFSSTTQQNANGSPNLLDAQGPIREEIPFASLASDEQIPLAERVPPTKPPEPGIIRRINGGIGWTARSLFCIASLVALLAFLSAIPLIQLIAFGYLLDVAGRLTQGEKFRNALPNLQRAGMIGLAVTMVFLASLPTQLLVHWESVAQLINKIAQSGIDHQARDA